MKASLILGIAIAAPAFTPNQDVPSYFYPKNEFQTFEPKAQNNFVEMDDGQVLEMGKKELAKQLGVGVDSVHVKNSFKSADGTTHIYASRLLNGLVVQNQNAAIHIKDGQVVAKSGNVPPGTQYRIASPSTAKLSPVDAVRIAESELKLEKHTEPKMVYIQLASKQVTPAFQFQVRGTLDGDFKWYQVSVDAASGQIIQTVDFVRRFSFGVTYEAIDFPKQAAEEVFSVINPDIDVVASPLGWHDDGTRKYDETMGNNVFSHIKDQTVKVGQDNSYRHSWSKDLEPESSTENQRAAIINNFYVSNVVHDISYKYGFTEAAGNFQKDNFNRGGEGNDRVNLTNQFRFPTALNNAFMATPPDGQAPLMAMFIWNQTTPKRDSSLDNSVIVHEYTHGISNRLTGGNRQGECLETDESGGLGEGWSDTVALYLSRKPTNKNTDSTAIGYYVANKTSGIRRYPYSTDMQVNPLTYNSLFNNTRVHSIGTTWATILNDMYWNLVDVNGFNPNWYDSKSQAGNIVAMQIVIGGMMVQPCNPTLLQARDAILVADSTYYGAKNKCLIWNAFARRGAGVDAIEENYVDGFKKPEECQ